MNPHLVKLNPNQLASRVAEGINALHDIAYAQIAPDLTVVQVSENFWDFLPEDKQAIENIEGQPLAQLLWEFIGAESSLERLLNGDTGVYRLNNINRTAPDGGARYLNFIVLPQDEKLPGKGCILIAEDVTATRQLEHHLAQERNELRIARIQLAQANEELQRLNQLKSLFLSIVAHDMRSPLFAILGYSEFLQGIFSQDEQKNYYEILSIIISQVEWLNRLITDLLDLDQIEQGKLTIHPELCNLASIVHDAADAITETARLQKKTLSLELAETKIPIMADPNRIGQILHNLVGNAIKYTSEGGQIQVSVWANDRDGILQVKDNGIGMSQEQQEYLFQLYYRTEEARKSKIRGAGLGLFIVKNLVDAQQGKIEVSSNPGVGTTFTISLPLNRCNSGAEYAR